MENQMQVLVVMVIYMGGLIIWGLYQGRKVKTSSEYAIAGRNLPGWVAALSERATGESSWALLGLPGAAYAFGLTEIWTAVGCVAGIISAWTFISWRLRDEAARYNAETFTGYLAKRHGEWGTRLMVLSSLTIVFFFFFYVGAQFLGGGKTLHTMFGIKPGLGMLITAAVIVPYTIYGGFRSVVYTDVIQAIVMIITLIVGPIAGILFIMKTPGLFASSIPDALRGAGSTYLSLTGAAKGFGAGLIITGGFSWFFGYLGGQPQLSMRFMAIKDHRQAIKARNIGIIWTIIAYIGAMSIGWIGIAIFGPAGLADPEYVMPGVIMTLFPPVIAAILITGAIAAMISTADSLLILSATELSESIASGRRKRGTSSPAFELRRNRMITALLALIALGLSYISPSRLIFTLVSYVWAGIGCTFSVVILFSLFWKRFNGRAAFFTVIAGLLFTMVWISGGFEQHYRVTVEKTTFLAEQQVLTPGHSMRLLELEGRKFISATRFEREIDNIIASAETEGEAFPEGITSKLVSAFTIKSIPARLLTFFVALFVAVGVTLSTGRREDNPVISRT